ncbi:hypothetical protein MKW92_037173 [Papaver armeniacum]|nr:hypothetical protein MKW92_037173 [Papaver armeniacum]
MDVYDWRTSIPAVNRQKFIDKITQSLTRQLPPQEFDAADSVHAAAQFEGDLYNSAKSQSDYLIKISKKIVTPGLRLEDLEDETSASSSTLAASVPTSAITTTIATATAAANETPSLTRGRIRFQQESVKRKLPVIEFGNFLRKSKKKKAEEADSECPICWDCLKRTDKIRELSRCSHVFHKECLDKWIDQQRFSCPYCRAHL